jgi:hypothetical protein
MSNFNQLFSNLEDGAHELQAKDRQIEEKIHRIVELRNELNMLK